MIFVSFGSFCGGVVKRNAVSLQLVIQLIPMRISSGSLTNSHQSVFISARLFLTLVFISFCFFTGEKVLAQSTEEIKNFHFNGTITTTNNGVSIIPSFNLGRPAAFFDLSIGGDRLSFDPMLRFGMDGKPWTFVLWGRYKVIKDKRFSLTVGGHPAFLFQEVDMIINGKPEKMHVTNRYLAGEINTSYRITKKFSIGLYYLTGAGLQVIGAKHSNFLALNSMISDLRLVKDLNLKINSQLFFLDVDGNNGMYFNSGFTFAKTQFPVQFQAFFNQKIKSDIAGDDLVWNLSLLYNFSNIFARK